MMCSHSGNTVATGTRELESATNITLSVQGLQNTHVRVADMPTVQNHFRAIVQNLASEFFVWLVG
jgi:hypothetical protein